MRATDPISGERYHALFNPPRTQEVKDRLQVHPKDKEEEVQKRYALYCWRPRPLGVNCNTSVLKYIKIFINLFIIANFKKCTTKSPYMICLLRR